MLFSPYPYLTLSWRPPSYLWLRCLCSPGRPSRYTSLPGPVCSICERRPRVLVGAAGGSVAVSLVDSCKFRTADERVIFLQPMAQFDHLGALPDSEGRARAIIEAMESIEDDYENLRGVLPKSEYQELDNDVLGQLLRMLNPDELAKYNESLTQARDLLLPRLMNGEVAV